MNIRWVSVWVCGLSLRLHRQTSPECGSSRKQLDGSFGERAEKCPFPEARPHDPLLRSKPRLRSSRRFTPFGSGDTETREIASFSGDYGRRCRTLTTFKLYSAVIYAPQNAPHPTLPFDAIGLCPMLSVRAISVMLTVPSQQFFPWHQHQQLSYSLVSDRSVQALLLLSDGRHEMNVRWAARHLIARPISQVTRDGH